MSLIGTLTFLLSGYDNIMSNRHSLNWLFNKRIVIVLFSLFFLLLGINVSMAVPACSAGAEVIQPDGTPITVFLRGDEHVHWNESKDGYLITKNEKSRAWVYMIEKDGVPLASGHMAGKADPRAIGAAKPNKIKLAADANSNRTKQLAAMVAQPAFTQKTGTMFNLVVLVNFSDLAVAYPRQSYDDLFNQIGYTADGAVGSVKDYYREVSYNALTVQSTVVEAVTLDNGYAYYGGNDSRGNDLRPREMVQQALAKLEARGFDFRTVDGDGDGWVDGLTIIHAGGGEEYSGNDKNYIWSHQWAMISTATYDGISMSTYHTEPARRGWDSSASTQGITRIGVICHENGHFLGLPDLYDYGYDSMGAGNFCLMAGGSWNGNYGSRPAHMSAWCKSDLGWVTPSELSVGGVYSLGQVETNTQIYKLQGAFASTEYFLLENRQGTGFDAGLPGTQRGILIWHVDEAKANNDDQTHYKVDLEEASGTQHLELNSNEGDDADYFRLGNATAFTGSTTPNNLSYTGQMLNLNINDVGTSSTNMSFTLMAGLPGKAAVSSPANGASEVSLSSPLHFIAGAGATSHNVYFGTTNPAAFWGNQTNTTFNPGSLLPNTTYYWCIDEKNAAGTTTGDVWSFTTVALPWNDGFESGSFTSCGWTTQNDNATIDSGAAYGSTGSYGAKLRKTTWIEKIKSTEGYNPIHVKYRRATGGLSGGENLYIEWSLNGITWNNLETVQVASYSDGLQSKVCGGADNNANFRIRFRTNYGPQPSKYAYVDDVQIAASSSIGIVPNIVGMTQAPAQEAIINSGLAVGSVTEQHDNIVQAGCIISQNPAAGTEVITGSLVNLVVSLGKPVVPDVVGMTQANATAAIAAVGALTMGDVTYQYSDTITAGLVISQNPVGNTTVLTGSAVAIVVSSGPQARVISGYVIEPDCNTPVAGVIVVANNGGGGYVTDANGFYQVGVAYNWSGTVTPLKEGYTFEPNAISYNNVTVNKEYNYVVTLTTFKISGRALELNLNLPLSNVSIAAENGGGQWTSRYGGGSCTTDANGYYTVVVDYNWSGKIVPTKYAYGFVPTSIDYNYVTTNYNNQDYTGKLLTFIISGYIKNQCNVPINGVLINASNGPGQCITDANGFYELWADYGWTGTVCPTKKDYIFEPNSITYDSMLLDVMSQDYAANDLYDLDCDGSIGFGDLAIVLQNWLAAGPDVTGNFNRDAVLDFLDFAIFSQRWLDGVEP